MGPCHAPEDVDSQLSRLSANLSAKLSCAYRAERQIRPKRALLDQGRPELLRGKPGSLFFRHQRAMRIDRDWRLDAERAEPPPAGTVRNEELKNAC